MSNDVICIIGAEAGILQGDSSLSEMYADQRHTVLHCDKKSPSVDHDNVHTFAIDVLKDEDVERLLSLISDVGKIDHLVNVVGGADMFEQQSDWSRQDIRSTVHLNLCQHIYTLHKLSHLFSDNPFASATLASSVNASGRFQLPVYSAAKAGLEGFVKSAANKYGGQFRVNAVSPGTVRTERTENEPKDFDALRRSTATGRLTKPEDIVEAVYYLSHKAKNITGQILSVDGGQLVKEIDYLD